SSNARPEPTATEDKGKGATGPKENLSLNFSQVSVAYAQQKANGTGVNPQPPATTSRSMAGFVPTGGLHPIAGGQATSTAKEGGLAGFLHSLANSIVGGDAWDRLKKAVEALPGEAGEDDEPE
ncbi:MAG TPA: hypothetical protein VIY30_14600, partial [Burkholderiaceae bacterium]